MKGATPEERQHWNSFVRTLDEIQKQIPRTLNDLVDVSIGIPVSGEYLRYDGISGKWTNAI